MSTKDIRTRDEIIVNVGKAEGDPKAQGAAKRRRGPIGGKSKRSGLLKRRQVAGAIQLFDLGQKRVGDTWESVAVQFALTLTDLPGEPGYRNVELSDFRAVEATYITEPGDWTTKFRKITKGGPLEANSKLAAFGATFGGFLVDLPSDVWTSAGLKVTPDDLAGDGLSIENGNGFVETFAVRDDGTYHITTLPTNAAPSVAFTPSQKMDIFLAPSIIGPGADAGYTNDAAAGGFYFDFAGYFYTTLFRDWLFDVGNPNYYAFNVPVIPGDSLGWAAFYYRTLFLRSQPLAKATRNAFSAGTGYTVISVSSFPGGPGFPTPPAVPPHSPTSLLAYYHNGGGDHLPWHSGAGSNAVAALSIPGALNAVVIKNGVKYYFWTP